MGSGRRYAATELVEHILQDVFRLACIRHTPPDEIPQSAALAGDGFSDALVLFGHHRFTG